MPAIAWVLRAPTHRLAEIRGEEQESQGLGRWGRHHVQTPARTEGRSYKNLDIPGKTPQTRQRKWRKCMGIEPTGHTGTAQPDGFEDRGHHQVYKHFRS